MDPDISCITGQYESSNVDRMSVTAVNRELSYEISPFKESDNEDGDDDSARRKKFVSSWARKESVNSNILANRHLNPYVVFSRKRSFDQYKSSNMDRMSVTAVNRELSYEISPFKESDDEDGDDDSARRKKFVPSWARKESVNSNILANRHLNPYVVFSRKRSSNTLKVLEPPVNRRPLPK